VISSIFISLPFSRKFEGYPTIVPIELVELKPISFEAPEVQKIVPKKVEQIKTPEPKKLEGVTIEQPKIVEKKPEPQPLKQPVEEPKESDTGKSAEAAEEIKLDVEHFPFSYYKAIIKSRIESNWEPPVNSSGKMRDKTVVHFRIERSGRISDIQILEKSGDLLFDRSTLRALVSANPLPPLPYDFPQGSLGVTFAFKPRQF
jgi:TonB family protein